MQCKLSVCICVYLILTKTYVFKLKLNLIRSRFCHPRLTRMERLFYRTLRRRILNCCLGNGIRNKQSKIRAEHVCMCMCVHSISGGASE